MKKRWFVAAVPVLVCLLFITELLHSANNISRSLTLLYTNNINGEIDPCPT